MASLSRPAIESTIVASQSGIFFEPSTLSNTIFNGVTYNKVAGSTVRLHESADGNPAELFEAKGEDLWSKKRGPKNASLERCNSSMDISSGSSMPASRIATVPEALSRSLKVFKQNGDIVCTRTTIIVKNPQPLEKFAQVERNWFKS